MRYFVSGIALTLFVLTTACSGGGSSVLVKGFRFQPRAITVAAGTKVVWRQEDNTIHTLTSGTPGKPSGLFDERDFAQGDQFSFTFAKPGTYPYFCSIHNSMRGTVEVGRR